MRYRYTRYTGDDLEGIDLDELISKLSRLLLSSGFGDSYGPYGDAADEEDDRSLQSLHDAILDALLNGGLLSDDALQRLLGDPADADQAEGRSDLEELIQELIRQMAAQGYISLDSDDPPRSGSGAGPGPDTSPARFQVTDKSLDFLGYRALRDLLGSSGRSSVGRHDTLELATGVEAGGASKPYEFGDTLNIDASGTILNAVRRGAGWRERRHPRGLPGSDGGAGRVPELVRDGANARLQPQHDPLRRGTASRRRSRWRWPCPT